MRALSFGNTFLSLSRYRCAPALNVASTRIVCQSGHEGGDAAG